MATAAIQGHTFCMCNVSCCGGSSWVPELHLHSPASPQIVGYTQDVPHLIERARPWDLTVMCVCGCWKLPFVCVTQSTGASTCKSRFLLDQMEKICLISLYSPSILLREHMLNTCCKSKVRRQDY